MMGCIITEIHHKTCSHKMATNFYIQIRYIIKLRASYSSLDNLVMIVKWFPSIMLSLKCNNYHFKGGHMDGFIMLNKL